MIRSRLARMVVAATLGVATVGVAVAVGATAASAQPTQCPPDPVTISDQTGIFYKSMGTAVGKYNPNSTSEGLSISLSQTVTDSTAWEAGASASVSFGIATVEANTSYTVTKTTAINKTVTDPMTVPGHEYGYAQPKAEYRTFHIYSEETNGNCKGVTVTHDYGYFDAITTQPFFAECTAKSACTPKP